jgi:hypothetical protein
MLSPVLVFGSGIHHQWLCDQDIVNHQVSAHAEALRSWSDLLRQVAERLKILHAIDEELSDEMPTLQWERMVLAYCDRRDKKLRAYVSERVLRKTLCETLLEAEREVETAVDFGKVLELREVLGRHTISLNLDSLLWRERPGMIRVSAGVSRHLALPYEGGTVWFPHGSVLRPASATLGLRAYGRLAPSWENMIKAHKVWGRKLIPQKDQNWSRTTFTQVMDGAAQIKSETSGSLAAHLMLAPLMIFGGGVRREEWGIWWLLNQRARNLARVPEHLRPPTVIVIKNCDARLPFWVTRPANVSPIIINQWQDAWSRLIEWMGTHKEMARS